MSAFVVDGSQVEVTRTEEKLGLNSSVTNDIAVDTVVGHDRLIGERNHGFRIAMATLDGAAHSDCGPGSRDRAGCS